MTYCNFQEERCTQRIEYTACSISGRECSGSNCLFQRILAALPLTHSPIVAQAMDAIGTGPGEALPHIDSITFTPPTHNTQMYTQAQAADKLGVTVPTVSILSKQHSIGTRDGRRITYSAEDIEQLRGHLKGGSKQKRNTNCNTKKEKDVLQNVIQPEPAPPITDRAMETIILHEYRTYAHIKLEPDVVAKKLNLDPKRVRKICELLNEERKLCFAGTNGYFSKDPLPAEEL